MASRRIKVRILNPRRRRRRSRGRRRNPAYTLMNPRRSRRRRHTKWGRISAHKRRVNPRRRARRRNPAFGSVMKRALTAQNIIRYLAMGGGFYLGTQVSGFLSTGRFFGFGPSVPPGWTATIKPARPAFGVLHMILGALVASKAKQPLVRDAAVGIAVAGGYDIVQQVSAMLLPSPASTAAGVSMQRSMLRQNGMNGVSMPRNLLRGVSMPRRDMRQNAVLDAAMG